MDSLDQHDQEKLIFMITLPLSFIIIITNLLLIIGIACNRQLYDTPNKFFLSLLVADLCTGFALPFIPRMGLDRSLHFIPCLLVHILPNFLFLSFLFNLVMVHYERYSCIVHPLHYSQFWVHRCFPVALLSVWIPPLVYSSLPAFGWNNWTIFKNNTAKLWNCTEDMCDSEEHCSYRQIFTESFIYLEVYGLLLPAIISILVMTGRILWIARKQVQDICKLSRSVEAWKHEHHLNLRYAKCVAAVSFTFLVCWVPYIVYLHFSVAVFQKAGGQSSSVIIILSCLGVGSMAIIPTILSLANRQYTKSLRNMLIKMTVVLKCCK